MAQRTRALRVKFYNPDTLAERSIPQGYLNCVEGRGKGITSKVGSGSAKIPIDELAKLTGAYTTILMHDIAVVYNINGAYTEKVGSFIVRSQKLETSSYGNASYTVLSGPDELYYLGKARHYLNIGKEYSGTVMDHNLQGGSLAGWPFIYLDHGDTDLDTEGMTGVFWPKWTLKKAQSLHTGEGTAYPDNNPLKLVDAVETAKAAGDKWAIGDDISIVYQFSPYGQHTTSVTDVETAAEHGVDSYYWVTIKDPMTPKKADDAENPGTRYYPTFSSTIFKGDPVSIQMDGGTWHTTRIRSDARYNGFFIEEAAPLDISRGAAFKWWNSREPNTTNDIELCTQNLTNWTVNGTASSKGSFHVIDTKGADILNLLMKTADATSDHFYAANSGPTDPYVRSLEWKTSNPFSDLTLTHPASYADGVAKQAGGVHAFVHSISMISRDLPISIVVPKSGANDDVNTQVTLGHCTETPEAGLLRLHGITALDSMTTAYVNGAWRVTNDAGAVPIEEFFEFEDIYPRSNSGSNIERAANIMQARCALILHNRRATENVYNVLTALPDGKEISVGETIYLVYSDNEWDISELLYIAELEHFVTNTGKRKGIRQTRLQLSSDGPRPRDTGSTVVAKGIRKGITSTGFGVGTGGLGGGDPEDEGSVPGTPGTLVIVSSVPTGALSADGMELTFELNHNDGLTVSGNDITMTIPTVDLSVSSTNAIAAGGHTHAIDNTTDGDSNPSTIMAVDSNGRMAVSGLGIGTSPGSDNIIFHQNSDAEGEGWTSGRLGAQWGIDTQLGHIDARSAYFDELHVTLFTADETLVSAGTHWVTPGMGKFSREWTIPAVSSSTTVYLWDSEALPDSPLFRNNSKVMVQVKDTTGAGITLAFVWGTLTSYSDESGNEQSWTFTTGSLGAAVGGNTVPAESVCLGFGLSGQGFHSIETNDLAGSPYSKIATWVNNPWTPGNLTEHVRLGNLNGLANLGEEWGLYVGVAPTGPRAVLSDTRFELHDVGLTMYAGTAEAAHIKLYAIEFNTDVTTAIAPNAGVSAESASYVGVGYWQAVADDPAVGQPDADYVYNNNGTSASLWLQLENIDDALTEMSVDAYCAPNGFTNDFCTLRVQIFKADGLSELTNEIQVFNDRTTTGLVTAHFSNIDTTATQIEWDAALVHLRWVYNIGSGAGDEVLTITPNEGIDIVVADSASFASERALTYTDASGNEMSGIYGRYNAGTNNLRLIANPISGYESSVDLYAEGGASQAADITMRATADNGGGVSISLLLDTTDDIATLTASDLYAGGEMHIQEGLIVGISTGTPAQGTIILDQRGNDGSILEARSDDVTGMTTQGLPNDNTYFEIRKLIATSGASLLRGGGEGTIGMYILGSANTADATENYNSEAPIVLDGRVDNASVGSGNNVVAIANNSSVKWICKDSGDTYQDGDMYDAQNFTPDFMSDVIGVRSLMLLSGDAIRTSYDDTEMYTRDELVTLGLVKGKHTNRSRIVSLNSGAIWELHKRLSDLEDERHGWLARIARFVSSKLGFSNNNGTIPEN